MSKTIIGAMPIRTVGLTPGHRWCGELRSVKPAVNNGKGARGLVQGLNSLNATYIRQGRIRDRPRKLAKDLLNGHLAAVATALLGPPAKREGRRLLWLCPFPPHEDHHPSFQVDPDRRQWRCWPCGIHGDAAKLVMKLQGVAFPEAARIAAELSGIATASGKSPRPTQRPRPPAPAASPPLERSSGLPLADALTLVTEAADRLWKPEGTEALDYLHGRCLTDETIKAARLGWTPCAMVPTRDGDRCYPVRGVVISWFDRDRLALVKIRDPDAPKPKRYKEAFRDRPGIYPCPKAIRPGWPLIIGEGELDALLLGQELRDLAAVMTLGPSSKRPDAGVIGRMLCAPVRFIALDADKAGDKAAAEWPARAIRVRPPEPFKDWTEAAQAGIDLRCWWLPRLGGTEALWNHLAALRWGPALNDPTPGIIIEPEAIPS